ncbi:MAG: glycosyltransferase family 4 protein [Paraprevotella sp.]|nr:glycosyltransferase family 4 protein [Paraprevotella sp.]
MKVLNLLWAFNTGGIGKCFVVYHAAGDAAPSVEIKSVVIDLLNIDCDREPLHKIGATLIGIKNRKDFSWIKRLNAIINEYSPDVILCHGFNGPIVVLLARLFGKQKKVPMVCTYHGLYNPMTSSRKPIANLINRIQAWTYKRYAKTVVLVAKYSGKYLLEHHVPEDKMKVVYNGIKKEEPNMASVQLSHKGISIGLAGRLDAIKGINYLIDAIPEVAKRVNVPFHIYLVGNGPEEAALKEQLRSLRVEEYISFEGYQNNVPAWLKSWDVFVLPSLQENHSIALLEAMRAGKAIVTTSVGGNPETVVDGKEALMIPPKDTKALADALVRILNAPALRMELGKNAQERFLRDFTEDKTKQNLINVLKSAIQ